MHLSNEVIIRVEYVFNFSIFLSLANPELNW